jgi:transcriptional regulator with XRE-family HTH domain
MIDRSDGPARSQVAAAGRRRLETAWDGDRNDLPPSSDLAAAKPTGAATADPALSTSRDPLTVAVAGVSASSEGTPAADISLMDPDLGVILTLLRSARGWNQGRLSQASGLRASSISDYERGRKIPELATLLRMLRAMDLPLAAIDLTRSYLAALRGGGGPGSLAPELSWSPPSPTGDADLAWEIEQAARQLGDAHARVTRAGLLAIRARPAILDDDQTAAAPAAGGSQGAAARRSALPSGAPAR